MNEEQTLARVRELEDIITRLVKVRDEVSDFRVDVYRDAESARWAGEQRSTFTACHDRAKDAHARVAGRIEAAIGDCKSRQRALASSINPVEHPVLAAQAWLTAVN